MGYSRAQCDNFMSNTEKRDGKIYHKNPKTERFVVKNGSTYKQIYKYCDQHYYYHDRIDKEVNDFNNNPDSFVKPNKSLVQHGSDYARLYELAYVRKLYDKDDKKRPSSEVVKSLPKHHILFNNKLDLLHWIQDRSAFSEEMDEVHKRVLSLMNIFPEKWVKYPKGLHANLKYDEKYILFAYVSHFIQVLATYVQIVENGNQNKKLWLSEIKYYLPEILIFNKEMKTYPLFYELFLKAGKKIFAEETDKETAKKYDAICKKLFADSADVVQTLLDIVVKIPKD